MGHADIKMTANIYTHIDDSVVLDVADKLNLTRYQTICGIMYVR